MQTTRPSRAELTNGVLNIPSSGGLSASVDGRQHPFDELTAGRRVGPKAGVAPAGREAQRPLGVVVGGLDALGRRERPQRRLDLEDLAAGRRRLR